jgi:hypothetical protein
MKQVKILMIVYLTNHSQSITNRGKKRISLHSLFFIKYSGVNFLEAHLECSLTNMLSGRPLRQHSVKH